MARRSSSATPSEIPGGIEPTACGASGCPASASSWFGLYLFVGLTWFPVFSSNKALYMAALAFSAYGIHWFAMGWVRLQGADPRPNGYMSMAFIIISVLGFTFFFVLGTW